MRHAVGDAHERQPEEVQDVRVDVKVGEGDEGSENADASGLRDDLAPPSRVRSRRGGEGHSGSRPHLDGERDGADDGAAGPAFGGDREGRDDDAEAGRGSGLAEARERDIGPSVRG